MMSNSFNTKYKVIQKIGEGSFSEVVKCQHKQTGAMYAAKRLKKLFRSMNDVMNCAEIKAMIKLTRHPNVLYMLEYLYDPQPGRLIFIFELMDMSMFEFMKLKKRSNTESRVKNFLYQILRGLEHLHRNGLFHRDIKPENILIKLIGSSNSYPNQYPREIVKLADLGSVRGIYSAQPFTEYISTRWYRSPECLLTNGGYGPKMDIWATGCVFYEMLTLKPLFPGTNELDQLAKIHSIVGTPSKRLLYKFKKRCRFLSNFPKQVGRGLNSLITNVSEDGRAVLHLMIQYDPDVRTNVRRLIEHRYFNSLRENDLLLNCKNRGDYPLSALMHYITNNKCYTNRSSATNIIGNKPNKTVQPFSKTTVDLNKYNVNVKSFNNKKGESPLAEHRALTKAWIVDHDLTKYMNIGTYDPHYQQQKAQRQKINSQRRSNKLDGQDKDNFRKTTSQLPQYKKNTNEDDLYSKGKQFQSKSFVIPRRVVGKVKLQTINDLYLPCLNKQKSI